MAIMFQPRIVGNGPYKHVRWIERHVKKMCAEIVKAKMIEETGETEEMLFQRVERKYGIKRFSDLCIHIDRGSVKYDVGNRTWYGTFRVITCRKQAI